MMQMTVVLLGWCRIMHRVHADGRFCFDCTSTCHSVKWLRQLLQNCYKHAVGTSTTMNTETDTMCLTSLKFLRMPC